MLCSTDKQPQTLCDRSIKQKLKDYSSEGKSNIQPNKKQEIIPIPPKDHIFNRENNLIKPTILHMNILSKNYMLCSINTHPNTKSHI